MDLPVSVSKRRVAAHRRRRRTSLALTIVVLLGTGGALLWGRLAEQPPLSPRRPTTVYGGATGRLASGSAAGKSAVRTDAKPKATVKVKPVVPRTVAARVPVPPSVGLPAGTPAALLPPKGSTAWLPTHRIVAYYGNPLTAGMGVLGAYPPATLVAHLKAQALAYAQAAPKIPVVPALDMVATVAQGSPGAGGKYRLRMTYALAAQELALARRNHMLLILDIQVGRSTVQSEVRYWKPFLEQPDVQLALDPEFDMPPGKVPGQWIGTMHASAINWALGYLSRMVRQRHLPAKIVEVYEFRSDMLTHWNRIHPQPGTQMVFNTDGFGGQALKIHNYHAFITRQPLKPVRYGGIKLFYHNDVPLLQPAQVVALKPPPLVVTYQ